MIVPAARPRDRRATLKQELTAVLLIAVGLLVIVSLHTEATGVVGAWIGRLLRRGFGAGADIAALVCWWAAGAVWVVRRNPRAVYRTVGALLLTIVIFLSLAMWNSTGAESKLPRTFNHYFWNALGIHVRAEMDRAEAAVGGGAVGTILWAMSWVAFGRAGTVVVAGALAIAGILLLFDLSLRKLGVALVPVVQGAVRGFTGAAGSFTRLAKGAAGSAVVQEQDTARMPDGDDHAPRWNAQSASGKPGLHPTPSYDPSHDGAAGPVGAKDRTGKGQMRTGRSGSPKSVAEVPEEREPIQLSLLDSPHPYRLPPASLLRAPQQGKASKTKELPDQSRLLEETLQTFGVHAKVVQVSRGPVVTRYELQPAPGVKVSRIVGLSDDIALSLAAAGIRIEAPVPGKNVVGIEVPNKETSPVYLRDVLESDEFRRHPSKLAVALGKDIAGNPVVADLVKLIHLLIAGSTGSGKSVCLGAIISSLLFKAHPSELKLLMIDPKRVELTVYDGIPHLVAPVVTDPKKAAVALRWVCREMEQRYQLFTTVGARNIDSYNRLVQERGAIPQMQADHGAPPGADEGTAVPPPHLGPLPYMVVIIDELADLMLVAASDVEDAICRLAQMARASGIHLIVATQRPSVDVITGLIKANIPSRLAFAVASQVDSRTVLDMAGAERLLGRGDMLFDPAGAAKPMRAQGAYVSDKEIEELVAFWKSQAEPTQVEENPLEVEVAEPERPEMDDDLLPDAIQLVVDNGQASVSLLQRRFRIGYSRAARLIDMMEQKGIVGPYQGSKPREILISRHEAPEHRRRSE